MRKVIEKQLKIGQVDICNIQIDLRSRDEIPQLLSGLQAICKDRQVREMDLWKILVLGTLRLDCNRDYDKLHEIANNHKTVREFLGHTIFKFDICDNFKTVVRHIDEY